MLTQRDTPRHIPALDGLRGLAVAGVLIFHAGHLTGGYLGVDLFFVLSGFLITTLLIGEFGRKGDIELKNFWVRRARRLMPALIALLVLVTLYAAVVAKPVELDRIRGDALATLAYVANWHSIYGGISYWQIFSAPSPLDHTWSLAIEEQFYLVWPFVVWGLFKLTTRRSMNRQTALKVLLGLCVTGAVGSVALMFALYDAGATSRVYQGSDTRGAAILLGAALATAMVLWGPVRGKKARVALEVAAIGSFVGLMGAWYWLDGQSWLLYHGGLLATEVFVLFVLASVTHPDSGILGKAMSIAPLRWLGLISYGVYLYHWPVFVLLNEDRVGFGGLELAVVQIAVSIAIAVLSFFLLETPIRRHGLPHYAPARFVVPSVLGLCAVLIFLGTLGGTASIDTAGGTGTSVIGHTQWDAKAGPKAPKVLVEGDSVAQSLGVGMHTVEPNTHVAIAVGAFPACQIFPRDVKSRNAQGHKEATLHCDDNWSRDVKDLHPDATLIVVGGAAKNELNVNGKWVHACEPGWGDTYAKGMKTAIQSMKNGAGQIMLATSPRYSSTPAEEGKSWVPCLNDVLRDIAKQVPNVRIVDLDAFVCPDGKCRQETDNGDKMREDGLHFRGKGGEFAGTWLAEQSRRRG